MVRFSSSQAITATGSTNVNIPSGTSGRYCPISGSSIASAAEYRSAISGPEIGLAPVITSAIDWNA